MKTSRIRKTKHLLTDADSSTDTKKNPPSEAKFAKKTNFVLCGDFTLFINKKFSGEAL